jgi:hypothetical protein
MRRCYQYCQPVLAKIAAVAGLDSLAARLHRPRCLRFQHRQSEQRDQHRIGAAVVAVAQMVIGRLFLVLTGAGPI